MRRTHGGNRRLGFHRNCCPLHETVDDGRGAVHKQDDRHHDHEADPCGDGGIREALHAGLPAARSCLFELGKKRPCSRHGAGDTERGSAKLDDRTGSVDAAFEQHAQFESPLGGLRALQAGPDVGDDSRHLRPVFGAAAQQVGESPGMASECKPKACQCETMGECPQ